MDIRDFQKAAAPLFDRVMNLVTRGIITRVNDTPDMQTAQVSLFADEAKDEVERFQPFGLTSVPLPGAECVVLFLGGARDHGVIVAVDDREYRPTNAAPGEVVVYGVKNNVFRLKPNGDILIETTEPGGTIRMAADNIDIHANDNLYFDAGGHGFHYQPTHVDSYTGGATGTGHLLAPPEIPD